MDKSENISSNMNSYSKARGGEFSENSSVRFEMDVYGRQNSMNEIKENDLLPKPGQTKLLPKPGQTKLPGYARQLSGCPFITEKTVKVDMCLDNFQSTSTLNSDTVYDKRKENYCCRLFQALSFLVTVLTLGLVIYLYNKMGQIEHIEIHHVTEGRVESLESKYVYTEESDDVSGSFKLDQHYLLYNNTVRWMKDESSKVVPSITEPCLTIPDDGKYLVISRFTFLIPPGEKETILTHQLELKAENEAGEITRRVFKRQYVSIVEQQLKASTELRKSSNFIQSFELHAGNEVCTKVSNPELLYISSIDNDVTIIKV